MVYLCCYCNIKIEKGENSKLTYMNGLDELILIEKITYSIEHLVPRSKGGKDIMKNKKACCSICNYQKGNKNLDEYIIFLENQNNKLKYNTFIDSIISKFVIELNNIKIKNAFHLLEYIENCGIDVFVNEKCYNKWKNNKLR